MTTACDDDSGAGRLSAFTLNLSRDESVVLFVGGSGLATLSCGGGGGSDVPTFTFTLDPGSFVLQGQTTGEVLAGSGSAQIYELSVLAPES